jgi:hypothetical protein
MPVRADVRFLQYNHTSFMYSGSWKLQAELSETVAVPPLGAARGTLAKRVIFTLTRR